MHSQGKRTVGYNKHSSGVEVPNLPEFAASSFKDLLSSGRPAESSRKNTGRPFGSNELHGNSPSKYSPASLEPKRRLHQYAKEIINPLSIKKMKGGNKEHNASFEYSSPLSGVSEGESKKQQAMKEYQLFALGQLKVSSSFLSPSLAKKKSYANQATIAQRGELKLSPESGNGRNKQDEYKEELMAQIKWKEDTRKREREKEMEEAVRGLKAGMKQDVSSRESSRKALLRDELLAQIEEKKKREAEERIATGKDRRKASVGSFPGESNTNRPPPSQAIMRTEADDRDRGKEEEEVQPAKEGGIMEFISRLKSQEREVEQKRQDTLKQLERIKHDIQRSIRADREERMHVMQDIDTHATHQAYVPRIQQQQQQQQQQQVQPMGGEYEAMSITSGTSFSSNSLAQNSQFVAIPR